MRALRTTLLVLSLASVPLVGCVTAASAAALPADGIGFNVPQPFLLPQDEADNVRDLDAAAKAGLTRVRFVLPWNALEPDAPNRWDERALARADHFVDLALARGIEPSPILLFTPTWARGGNALNTAPPTDPATFGRYAGRLAAHFGSRVDSYQIWNEPNLVGFWGGLSDPAGYTRLLKAAYPAIKAANPSATVLAAALAPTGDALLGMSAVTYYTGIYRAGGKGFFDAAAAHPYTWAEPRAWTTEVDATHAVMAANGDGGKKIWITESGISTADLPPGVTEQSQSAYLLDAASQAASRPYVGPMFIYGLRDTSPDPLDQGANFGLLRFDFSPKPAYDALVALKPPAAPAVAAPVAGCRSPSRIVVRLRRLSGAQRYVRVAVRVGTGRRRVSTGRRLRTATVDLRGRAPKRYRVSIAAETATGRTVRISRVYLVCASTPAAR